MPVLLSARFTLLQSQKSIRFVQVVKLGCSRSSLFTGCWYYFWEICKNYCQGSEWLRHDSHDWQKQLYIFCTIKLILRSYIPPSCLVHNSLYVLNSQKCSFSWNSGWLKTRRIKSLFKTQPLHECAPHKNVWGTGNRRTPAHPGSLAALGVTEPSTHTLKSSVQMPDDAYLKVDGFRHRKAFLARCFYFIYLPWITITYTWNVISDLFCYQSKCTQKWRENMCISKINS